MEKALSLGALTTLLGQTNAAIYGFIVSQKVYDGLKAAIPAKFEGGNSFNSTPIVVDPDMGDTDFEVAFTKAAWLKRVSEIRS